MLYFANPTCNSVDYMLDGTLGYIDTPLQGNKRPEGVVWCADNGCFNDQTFNEEKWWTWLQKHSADAAECKFATAPDVVGDHAATLERSWPWLSRIRSLGYPAAFVAQDGATTESVPWQDFDALFVGGTDNFKLGPVAIELMKEAKSRGMWVHLGRVNSRRRYISYAAMQYRTRSGELVPLIDSCDGTYLVFGPLINLPKLLSWIDEHKSSQELFPLEVK